MSKKQFQYGDSKELAKYLISEEINYQIYQCVYPVRKDDVVLDLGASIGPFTWSIMDRASKVYAIEPLEELQQTLKENTINQGYPVEIVQKVLYYDNIDVDFNDNCIIDGLDNRICQGTTFNNFLKEYNVDRIDFIKFDCEGGEYYLFRDENMDFLRNNVRNLVGEFHISKPNEQVEFLYFKDKFLKQFPHFKVYSVNNVDIGWELQNYERGHYGQDQHGNIIHGKDFFNRYDEIIIHISNEKEGTGPGYAI
jgi:FkbM family methyltransferase|tara:strand:- start:231 stop:986 length:756 start_codon:yes stop_codon:yes gene_type:complete